MRNETAKTAISKLAGFFNRKLTEELVMFYVSDFKLVDDSVFESAVDEACRAEKSFPTPRVLRDYINTAQRRKQEALKSTVLADVFRDKPTDSECFRESRDVLRRISEGKLVGDDLIAEMALMEKSFPGRGWGREAHQLQEHFQKRHGGAVDR